MAATGASTLEARLNALKSQLNDAKKNLSKYQAQLKTYSGSKTQAGIAKAREAQAAIKLWQQKVDTYSKTLPNTQNQYYLASGQYDKLLTGENRDAFMALQSLFNGYGLGTLSSKIYDYVKSGYSADTITILLQDTPEYKKRFAANELRQKNGLPVLSPAEYLSTEASYRQILNQSGLPKNFYDSPDDFTNWIAGDVSPTEVQSRVDLATQATVLAAPSYRQALNAMGIPNAYLTAYFLDPKKALPMLQKSAATAAIGAQALEQGLTFDQGYSEQLATEGISGDQARQGYSQIAQNLGTLNTLGQISGSGFTQREAEQATFEQNANAQRKQRKLVSTETARFGGSSGTASGGLAQTGGAR